MTDFEALANMSGGILLEQKPAWLEGYAGPLQLLVAATDVLAKVFPRGADPLTATPVDVFPNSDGSGTPLAQPLKPDSEGRLPGYVAQPVALDIYVYGGTVAPRTIEAGFDALVTGVTSVNGRAGVVVLNAADVGAVPAPTGLVAEDLVKFAGGTFVRLPVGAADQVMIVRSDGTIGWVDPPSANAKAWGASTAASSSANRIAIQGALDSLTGGGAVVMPGPGPYTIDQNLLWRFGRRMVGEQGENTQLKADASMPLSNFQNGARSSFAAMIKWDGGDPWAHGVEIKNLTLDPSGIPGLGGMWFQSPGELSDFHNLRCNSTAALPRTLSDAQISSGVLAVPFTASTVTEDDVNALVTDRVDGDHTLAGPTIPAWTKVDRINYASPLDATALSVTLSKAPTASAANSNFIVKRPTDAFTFDGNAARGRIGTLNGIQNSGALLRLKNFGVGTWSIDSLSGDDNLGGILRISKGSTTIDPASVRVGQIKSEDDTYNSNYPAAMDPCVLLDRCGPIALSIQSGSFLTLAGRDVIRLDQSLLTSNGHGPSVELSGIEGQNWFNNAYTNIIHDTTTGEAIPVSPYAWTSAYPKIYFGRDVLLGGTSRLRVSLAAGGVLLSNRLAWGDANDIFQLGGDGKLQWGPGGASALDTNLYRSAAGVLKTDGILALGTRLDVSAASGTAVATGTSFGDKVALFSSGAAGHGFGVQVNRLVAYVATGAAFAVRAASGSGAASSGADGALLFPDGSFLGTNVQLGLTSRTYGGGGTITAPAAKFPWNAVTVNNATAFTIPAPTNPPDSSHTAELVVEIFNNTAGAMGAITWNAAYVFAVGAWVNPAAGKRRYARFEWNGANWICTSLATVDY